MTLEKITSDGDELTRHDFVSGLEDYIKQLLMDPSKASVSKYLMSHGINNEEFLPLLLKRFDNSDENSAILLRKETIKTDPETGKDRFSIKYMFPRENSYKKMRRLYADLFENYQTNNRLLEEDNEGLNEDGECAGSTCCDSSNGQFTQPLFGGKTIKRKINKITEAINELDQINNGAKLNRLKNFRFSPDALIFNGKLCNVGNGRAFKTYIINNDIKITLTNKRGSVHPMLNGSEYDKEIQSDIEKKYLKPVQEITNELEAAVYDYCKKPGIFDIDISVSSVASRLYNMEYSDLTPDKRSEVLKAHKTEQNLLINLFNSYEYCDGRYWNTSEIKQGNSDRLSIFNESTEQLPDDAIVFAFWNKNRNFNGQQGPSTKIDIIKEVCDRHNLDINKCYILSSNNNEIRPIAQADNLFLNDGKDNSELDLMRQQHLQGNSPEVQAFKKQAATSRDANIEKANPGKTIAQVNYEKGWCEESRKPKTIYLNESQLAAIKKAINEDGVEDTNFGGGFSFGYDVPASIADKNDPAMKRHNGKGGSISVNTVDENLGM